MPSGRVFSFPEPAYALHAVTIFLSAFLVFLVQPIIGKYLLPWFGGSVAVWATSLLVFTALLFLGYAYVYVISKQPPRTQARIHIALLAFGTVVVALCAFARASLYPSLDWTFTSSLSPATQVILALIASIGIPYFLLSTTGPLLQHWYSLSKNEEPYALYAISNFGSFLALGLYPFIVEPHLSLLSQGTLWSILYLCFAFLCIGAAAYLLRASAATREAAHATSGISWRRRFEWIAFSALPAAVLVAATNEITQALVSMPFLWIVPLALYLLSFTLAFRGWGKSGWMTLATLLSALLAYHYLDSGVYDVSKRLGAGLIFLFCISLFCNAQLYARRPGKHASPLLYLCISCGGMLGTLSVSLLAPVVFSKIWEFALSIGLSALAIAYVFPIKKYLRDEYHASARVMKTAVFCTLILVSAQYYFDNREPGYLKSRDFYGVVKITDWNGLRYLYNGGTLHGSQYLDEERKYQANTYYSPSSGVGLAISELRRTNKGPLRIAVVGLGTGSIAAYCKAGDTFVFYEIDPHIARLSRDYFSYLAHCPGSEVRIGDGRVVLEKESREGAAHDYDLIAIDAFSDDTIPTHLLTAESFALYAKRLSSRGLIAIHTSNRYLQLAPVAARIGEASNFTAKTINDGGDDDPAASSSQWVIFAQNPQALMTTAFGTSTPEHIDSPLWTDDYVNVLAALKLPPLFEWSSSN